jgi:hypothetical protein
MSSLARSCQRDIRYCELHAERLQVEAELAALQQAPVPIALHPATLGRYVKTVSTLAEAMADHASAEDDRGPLVTDFRALVHSVVIQPKGPRQGFEIEVLGSHQRPGYRTRPVAHHPAVLVGLFIQPLARWPS